MFANFERKQKVTLTLISNLRQFEHINLRDTELFCPLIKAEVPLGRCVFLVLAYLKSIRLLLQQATDQSVLSPDTPEPTRDSQVDSACPNNLFPDESPPTCFDQVSRTEPAFFHRNTIPCSLEHERPTCRETIRGKE